MPWTIGGPNARPGGPGWTVEHVAETGSTNADLLATAAERPDRSVLVADHQTAGRGRLDRRWDAPPGANLLVSILFHDVPAHPSELTRRVALAAVDACAEVAGVDVALKWPNDLLVGDRKLAGILAERNAAGSVVVGHRPQRRLGAGRRGAPGHVRAGRDPDDVLARAPRAPTTRCRPTPTSATAPPSARSDGACASSCPTASSRARRPTSSPTAASSCVDTCAVTHRLAVGDVVHLRPA